MKKPTELFLYKADGKIYLSSKKFVVQNYLYPTKCKAFYEDEKAKVNFAIPFEMFKMFFPAGAGQIKPRRQYVLTTRDLRGADCPTINEVSKL